MPKSRYLLFFSLAVVGCAVDLWTKCAIVPKYWVRGVDGKFYVADADGMPRGHLDWWIWEDLLGIESALNEGALFGMGQGMTGWFALLSVLAVAGIVYWLFLAHAARDLFLTIALGLITGGILGNLYDRLGLWGGASAEGETIYAVRDWILVAYGGYNLPYLGTRWPNFNIADSLLVCGAGMLIWQAIRKGPDDSPPVQQALRSAAPPAESASRREKN